MYIRIIVLLGFSFLYSNGFDKSDIIHFDQDKHTVININNWIYWVSCDTVIGKNPYGPQAALFPKNTAGVLFCDGLYWAGFINNM